MDAFGMEMIVMELHHPVSILLLDWFKCRNSGGEKDHRPAFYQAIDFVNILYERTLTENKRHWLPHIPYMFNRKIMRGKPIDSHNQGQGW